MGAAAAQPETTTCLVWKAVIVLFFNVARAGLFLASDHGQGAAKAQSDLAGCALQVTGSVRSHQLQQKKGALCHVITGHFWNFTAVFTNVLEKFMAQIIQTALSLSWGLCAWIFPVFCSGIQLLWIQQVHFTDGKIVVQQGNNNTGHEIRDQEVFDIS